MIGPLAPADKPKVTIKLIKRNNLIDIVVYTKQISQENLKNN